MRAEHDWTVQPDDHGIRPAGQPDRCFYCGRAVGQTHREDCVIRDRTIVCRLSFEYTVRIPEDWTPERFEEHRNEGTWCMNNAMHELDGVLRRRAAGVLSEALPAIDQVDLCYHARVEFVREADEADQVRDGVHVPESSSRRHQS